MSSQEKVLNYFDLLLKRNALGTSYLFVGNNFPLVKNVLKTISCPEQAGDHGHTFCSKCWDCLKIDELNHPDLYLLEPDPLTIKIEKIREAQRFLSLKGFRLRVKMLVVAKAENFTIAAANAFLKTLEEPPDNSFIGLCVSKLEGVLPTIISRCRTVYLPYETGGDDHKDFNLPLVKSFLRGERIKFSNRKEFSSFLWTLIVLFRDHLLRVKGAKNNWLLGRGGCEIMLEQYCPDHAIAVIDEALKIYGVYTNINMNLALNMIRMRLQ